jgi:hypothetical protein
MQRACWAVVAAASVLAACASTTDGVPVAADAPGSGEARTSTAPTPTTSAGAGEPGVLPTERTPVPPEAVTCPADPPPPVGVMASVPDPAAPKITVALPTGWSTGKGDGDVGAVLTGPGDVTASVTISRTTLDPATAFRGYADEAMAKSMVSSISVLPGGLCGYSGQKLLGSWSDAPEQTVEFGDRLAHVWTDDGTYLVAVHVEGPADAADFDPFTSPLMDDFAIVIP